MSQDLILDSAVYRVLLLGYESPRRVRNNRRGNCTCAFNLACFTTRWLNWIGGLYTIHMHIWLSWLLSLVTLTCLDHLIGYTSPNYAVLILLSNLPYTHSEPHRQIFSVQRIDIILLILLLLVFVIWIGFTLLFRLPRWAVFLVIIIKVFLWLFDDVIMPSWYAHHLSLLVSLASHYATHHVSLAKVGLSFLLLV